jgi:hypothetical protein
MTLPPMKKKTKRNLKMSMARRNSKSKEDVLIIKVGIVLILMIN